jgi:hypothetical protein
MTSLRIPGNRVQVTRTSDSVASECPHERSEIRIAASRLRHGVERPVFAGNRRVSQLRPVSRPIHVRRRPQRADGSPTPDADTRAFSARFCDGSSFALSDAPCVSRGVIRREPFGIETETDLEWTAGSHVSN